MLGYEKREICILRLEFRSIKAVAVDGHDPVCIFGNNISVRIHAESPYLVLKLFSAVYDLALIKLRRQIREYDCRELDSDTNIHSVGICLDIKLTAHFFDPLAAGTAD